MSTELESLRRRLNVTTGIAGVGILASLWLGFAALVRPIPVAQSNVAGTVDEIITREIRVVDADGKVRGLLSAKKGQPVFELTGANGGSVQLGLSTYRPEAEWEDQAYLRLGSSKMNPEFRIGSGVGGSSLLMYGSDQEATVWLDSDPEGHSFLSFKPNITSNASMQLGMSSSGKPSIRLVDEGKRVIMDVDAAKSQP